MDETPAIPIDVPRVVPLVRKEYTSDQAYRDWVSDAMEAHGQKAAFMAGADFARRQAANGSDRPHTADHKHVHVEPSALDSGKPSPRDTARTFTDEQRAWLRSILTPPCCHVAEMHNPWHFAADPEFVCDLQASEAYGAALDALGFGVIPAASKPDCSWCRINEEREAQAKAIFPIGTRVRILRGEFVGQTGTIGHISGGSERPFTVFYLGESRHDTVPFAADALEQVLP